MNYLNQKVLGKNIFDQVKYLFNINVSCKYFKKIKSIPIIAHLKSSTNRYNSINSINRFFFLKNLKKNFCQIQNKLESDIFY